MSLGDGYEFKKIMQAQKSIEQVKANIKIINVQMKNNKFRVNWLQRCGSGLTGSAAGVSINNSCRTFGVADIRSFGVLREPAAVRLRASSLRARALAERLPR